MKWIITVGGGYGSFEFEGTKQEAETMRRNKARSESAPATKRRLTRRAPDALRVYDMGEVAGVKLTYVNGNVFATPAKRRLRKPLGGL